MMAQYLALKEQAGDCLLFYRMGDFFELFFDDARAAAAALDIALTSRGEHAGEPVAMCGVPVHAAEAYLARLIKAGHKVAIAEQTETPAEAKARAGSKALVARDIIRFVTPGTLTEDTLLDSQSANRLLALSHVRGTIGMAMADISTGEFTLATTNGQRLEAELARMEASEVLAPEGFVEAVGFTGGIAHWEARPAQDFDSSIGADLIAAQFGKDALGDPPFGRAETAAAAGLLAYLTHVTRGSSAFLQAPQHRADSGYLVMDAATRESLEITRSVSGARAHSLVGTIDRTVTGAGARLLAEDISSPLCNKDDIARRLALVGWLVDNAGRRGALRDALSAIADIGRALGRIVAGRGSPRDLGQVRDGLAGARSLYERLRHEDMRPALLDTLLPMMRGHGRLVDNLQRALVENPPTERAQGGYIASGYDAALDQLRDTSRNARSAIAALEARYREETGIGALKIKHNAVLGYFVEVPARHGDKLMVQDSEFTHRQTLAGAVRFNAPALHEEAMRIVEAGGHALAAEEAHFEELIGLIINARFAIADTASVLARLDVAQSHASMAVEDNCCCPMISEKPVLDIKGGRHPVVAAALRGTQDAFVANDCALSDDDRLWLISGPNMGGKSTFLRQNALMIILAQAGAYVPATSATIGIVDRLFSRVGASDNLARGRSTFMVEMVETAAILQAAGPNSFVILDEVGRGTSTYDGLALAWAVVEAVHDINRCRCLFATHYHELTRLAERLDGLSLHHVRAREWQGDLVLLHELATGPADRSYGLSVAKLAGVPDAVLARAKSVLERLEEGRAATGGLAAGLGDLPLFATALQEGPEPAKDALREALEALDLDSLSPRDALDRLYALKELLER